MKRSTIFLFGEDHGESDLLKKELELWQEMYEEEGMRHLFIEAPYYAAQFLNLWMLADNDTILLEIYDDLDGTDIHVPQTLDFYRAIKEHCPKTVFHGTDIGHQYDTTGERYLDVLKEKGREDSVEYEIALENIEQGIHYYKANDDAVCENADGDSCENTDDDSYENTDEAFRENTMVENFIREYDDIDNVPIMGIYGKFHTQLRAGSKDEETDRMARQLKDHYGDIIECEDIANLTG